MDERKVDTVKKSIYLPKRLHDFIEELSRKENRSFTQQVVTLAFLGVNQWYPDWEEDKDVQE